MCALGKNIVICCDALADPFATSGTNVLKLYSVLDVEDPTLQVAYYPAKRRGRLNFLRQVGSEAFGSGVRRAVAEAYSFLMENFEPDDQIFLFGFGSGAFVVRALASLLLTVGLLRKGNEALVKGAIDLLAEPDSEAVARFQATQPRECKPHFVGVWDTVSYVGLIVSPVFAFQTGQDHPNFGIVRHALAIDERRAYFKPSLWRATATSGDVKQVWFAGAHSDVGGGYPERESGLSKITLEWMIGEASLAGLRVKPEGATFQLSDRGDRSAPPDPSAPLHRSMSGLWALFELLPTPDCEVPNQRPSFSFAPRRVIPAGSLIHETVVVRRRANKEYRPRNLPAAYTLEPWKRWEAPLTSQLQAAPLDLPDDLVRDCAEGKCVLFAGAGLSAQASRPTWPQGLEKILQALIADPETGALWQPLRNRLREGDVDTTAELIASRLSSDVLQSRVQQVFAEGKPQLSAAHLALREIPFAFALTCNWDDLLERTFSSRGSLVLSPRDSAQFPNLLRANRFFVLRIYGDPKVPGTFLFTTADYRESMRANPDYARFVLSLLSATTILFVGASLKGIEDFLSAVRSVRGETGRTHYALVPQAADSVLQSERFLASYGVQLLSYHGGPEHVEVRAALERLRRAVKSLRPAGERKIGAAPLERVELLNIGPFTKLDTRFDPKFNVLLGNNGLGKSTLLKAIALCLCGDHEKAAPAARPLLRVGEGSGRIRLWLGQEIYESSLARYDKDVQVKPGPYTPLQSGTSVVLGFPALRGVSLRSIRGVSPLEEPEYPVVEDLLPLLTGGVDSRVDSLKQWIVNVAARAKTDPTAARMRDAFFGVLDQVSEGLKVTFKEVDEKRWQVIMHTADGDVPLESLSQGMLSVFGWVGALLERMFEIYASEEHPEAMPALVLVDEIDAHMHPAWQQFLVEALTQCFPNVQFIVSTHSPLIVGGLRAPQVKRFARDLSDKIVEVEVREDMTQGRADQVLTSMLFGLKTSMPSPVQAKIVKYQDLLKRATRLRGEEEELPGLKREVESLIPGATSDAVARLAEEVIDAVLDEQLGRFPEADAKVREKVRLLLAELVERSRIRS